LFESSGAAYVLDARSGFFYEPASDFFYESMTKLYYGNKQCTYFSHVPEEDPPFRPISNNTSGVYMKKNDPAKEAVNDAIQTVENFLLAAPPNKKEHAADIQKWSKRIKEIKCEVQVAEMPMQTTPSLSLKPEEQQDITNNFATTTTSGKPACLLCNRKFADVEKFKQHLKLSAYTSKIRERK